MIKPKGGVAKSQLAPVSKKDLGLADLILRVSDSHKTGMIGVGGAKKKSPA